MGPRHHWESVLLVLLGFAFCALLIVLQSCSGSTFIAATPMSEPDTSDCGSVSRTFIGKAPWTPTAIPFRGTRAVKMWAERPDGWEFFDGQLYLAEATWDVSWVSYMRMSLSDTPTIAVWDGVRWDLDGRIDVAPYLTEETGDSGRHYITARPIFHARGVKPKGSQEIPVTLTFWVCGPGHEFIQ
jgi:hypothetical protein